MKEKTRYGKKQNGRERKERQTNRTAKKITKYDQEVDAGIKGHSSASPSTNRQ